MRRTDWLPRLLEYVEAVRDRPHDPIQHNCGFFVAGAIEAMTGEDPRQKMGLRVDSMRDYAALLDVKALATQYAGEMQPRLLARRGDVVVRPGTEGDTLGICVGDHALFLGPDGLQPRSLDECEGCWRIG